MVRSLELARTTNRMQKFKKKDNFEPSSKGIPDSFVRKSESTSSKINTRLYLVI